MVAKYEQPTLFPELEPETPVFDVDEAVRKIGETASTPEHIDSVDATYHRDAVREGVWIPPSQEKPVILENPDDNRAFYEHRAKIAATAKPAGRVTVAQMNTNERRHIAKARADRRASGW